MPLVENEKRQACVITYANASTGWFPYFYSYYTNILGPNNIFVISPRPEEFQTYSLAGLVNMKDFSFDNHSRARLANGIAAGLLSYYDWIIMADADEIIIPHPLAKDDFCTLLRRQHGPICLSRGIDVLQMNDEFPFDFQKTVLEQRRFGLFNSALCKPHFANVPTRWGVGHHATNHKPDFPKASYGFVTLHLKWACQIMRNEVTKIVAGTNYNTVKTANYAKQSILAAQHPALRSASKNQPHTLNSKEVQKLEHAYISNMIQRGNKGIWASEHFTSDFLVDLSS